MTAGVARARGFTLIEVTISAVVLGVLVVSYAGFYRSQDAQRLGQERLIYAMELAARQIEFLRQADEVTGNPPFVSNYQTAVTLPVAYGTGPTLESAGSLPVDSYLTGRNSFAFSSDPSGKWQMAPAYAKAGTPPELVLAAELVSKGYGVQVRAARVWGPASQGPGPPSGPSVSPDQGLESLLIRYQVEVYVGGDWSSGSFTFASATPVLVVPYLKEVRMP